MQKVIGFSLALILASVVAIHTVDSVTVVAPAKKNSQPVSEEMVLIPAGEFQIEDREFQIERRDEGKWVVPSPVYISAFYIDKYEVTNAQYKKFVDANPEWSKANIDERFYGLYGSRYLPLWERNTYPEGKGNHPVEVSWYAAMAYAKWKGKRLPTAAEWRKAARGGWHIDSSKANIATGVGSKHVGTYPPNGYGLYDMVGNVSEWCLDKKFDLFFMVSSRRNPVAGVGNISHLMDNFTSVSDDDGRIGGLSNYGRVALGGSSRTSIFNYNSLPSVTLHGFRCVRDVKPGEEVQPPKDVSIPKSETGKPKTTKNRGTNTEKLVDKQKVVKSQQQVARDRDAEVRRKNSTEGMVLIPAGNFQMGTDQLVGNESKPIHTVYLDAFYIDTHEVTVGEYKEFLQESGYPVALHSELSEFSSTDTHPVVGVSWHDAMAYAQWAGKRLPTEAEWEKAARGKLIDSLYPWEGNEIDSSKANYGNLNGGTVPVGGYPSNTFGLYDMSGNVAEWCMDPWDPNFYANSPTKNPFAGNKSRDETIVDFKNVRGLRVIRGGSWLHTSLPVFWVSARLKAESKQRYQNIGFRCAKDAP